MKLVVLLIMISAMLVFFFGWSIGYAVGVEDGKSNKK